MVELIDRYDEKTGFTAMQRLTGWHGSILLIAAVNSMVRRGAVSVELALPGQDDRHRVQAPRVRDDRDGHG